MLDKQKHPKMWKCCQDPKAHARMGLHFWDIYATKKTEFTLDQLLDKTEAALTDGESIGQPGSDAEVARAQKQLTSAKQRSRATAAKLDKCKLVLPQARAVLEQATAAESTAEEADNTAKEEEQEAVEHLQLAP